MRQNGLFGDEVNERDLKTPDEEIRSLGGRGILKPADLPALTAAERRIFDLMLDHRWHTANEIIGVSGQREGLRRMRQLRRRGWEIERRRNTRAKWARDFEYRLVPRTPREPSESSQSLASAGPSRAVEGR